MPATKTLTALCAVVLGTQSPALALVKQPMSSNEIAPVNPSMQLPKQPNLIVDNNAYWGPQRDFTIVMPGKITKNTDDQLTSVSSTTKTVYVIIHRDFPQASRLPLTQVRQVLQGAMRESIGDSGKVIRTTNLVIDGQPGFEVLMQHTDGTLGQYRAFAFNQRLYFMGALTPDELTTETVNFFDSFRIYPQQIRYSSY